MDRLGDALLPITVFLPSDRAWSSLPQQQRDFLYDPHNRDQLLEYIRYHMVPYRQVALSQTPRGLPEPYCMTWAFQELTV